MVEVEVRTRQLVMDETPTSASTRSRRVHLAGNASVAENSRLPISSLEQIRMSYEVRFQHFFDKIKQMCQELF